MKKPKKEKMSVKIYYDSGRYKRYLSDKNDAEKKIERFQDSQLKQERKLQEKLVQCQKECEREKELQSHGFDLNEIEELKEFIRNRF